MRDLQSSMINWWNGAPEIVLGVIQNLPCHCGISIRAQNDNFEGGLVDIVLPPGNVEIVIGKPLTNEHQLSPAIFFSAVPNFG